MNITQLDKVLLTKLEYATEIYFYNSDILMLFYF